MTPEKIALAAGWTRTLKLTDTIQLACGVVMPVIPVDLHQNVLEIGSPSTGKVSLSIVRSANRITGLILEYFFYEHRLTPSYLAALKAVTDRSAPHVFMLLIDEILYHLVAGRHALANSTITLEDAADLDKGHVTPFSVNGTSAFRVLRNSRFLQWNRGYGYYTTFGYWPNNESVGRQQKYLLAAGKFAHRDAYFAPGDTGYQAAVGAATQHTTYRILRKTMPPTLPPLGPDEPLRTFTLNEFFRQVLEPGTYGKASGRRAVPAGPNLGTAPAMDRAVAVFNKFREQLRAAEAFKVPVFDPGAGGIIRMSARGWLAEMAEWSIRVTVLNDWVASISGPPVQVEAVTRYAESMAHHLNGGKEVRITWKPTEWPQERLVVAGSIVLGRRGVLGADALMAAGYHIKDLTMDETENVLAVARRCGAAGMIFRGDPMYSECHTATKILDQSPTWIRQPTSKRPRQQPDDGSKATVELWDVMTDLRWRAGTADRCRRLLAAGASTLNPDVDIDSASSDDVGVTSCIEYGHPEILPDVILADARGALRDAGATDEQATAFYDQALVYAADRGFMDAVQQLVADAATGRPGAANLDATWYEDWGEWLGTINDMVFVSPLVAATFNGHAAIVDFLLDQNMGDMRDLALAVAMADPQNVGIAPQIVNRLVAAGASLPADATSPTDAARRLLAKDKNN
jgi:hypothetical protein